MDVEVPRMLSEDTLDKGTPPPFLHHPHPPPLSTLGS